MKEEGHWHHLIEGGIKVGYPCTGFGCEHCLREERAKAPAQSQDPARDYCCD